MMRVALLFSISFLVLTPPVVRADDPGDPGQDLMFLGPTRPVLLRLAVKIDGLPFRQAWQEHLERTIDELDDDRDGRLTVEQAVTLYELVGGDPPSDAASLGPALAGEPSADGDTSVERESLAARLSDLVPLFNLRQQAGGSGPALFQLLDGDHDRRLSSTELADAAALLRRRDFNDDELFTEEELLASPRPRTADSGRVTSGNALIAIDDDVAAREVADAILARYDRNGDDRIALDGDDRETVPTRAIALLDVDDDGQLEANELAGFAARDPDVTIDVTLGLARSSRSATSRRPRLPDGFRLRRRIDGGYRLDVGDAEIELRRNNRDPARAAGDDVRLSNYDTDNNAYLDEEEAAAVPMLAGRFASADANGDGLIYPAELQAFVTRRAAGSALRLSLEFQDRGQDLFAMIDSTRDGRLTPRELNSAVELLRTEDLDGDGQLGVHEIPQRVQLHLVRGVDDSANARSGNRRRAATELVAPSGQGPRWFQKMDRNADGDVSRREFLGPLEDFARLDADNDGLLDAAEASAER